MSCRAKLAQIVDCHKCHKTTGQIIMPVFFNVSPTVVKKGSSDYEKAIARDRQEDPKTLQEWKKALIHLGSISGGTSNRSGTDASLIDELVVNVLRVLNRYLVDIEHDVERVMELLDEKSSDVRVVGIHGIRGIGKTTIAKLICTRMFRQFDGWTFLESLFSDLLGETHGQISSFEERIKLLKDQFVCMKFLIVLNDVGASFQLEQILRNPDWLGSGSRIIITTRKVQALAKLEGSRIHEVVGMQKGDTLKLFHTQAFRERPVPNEFDTLSKEIGTEILKGVLLEFGSQSHHSFGPAHFAGMSSIRFLQLDQADLTGNFKGCLSSLRWLHWQGCPWNLRAKNLDLEELVILDLSRSMVHEKWNGWIQIQKAKKLKVLNLTGCVHLIKTPDLSHFKCLERLILERCMRLDEIGPSVKSLRCLVSLNLRFCTELKKLPRELGSLTSLEDILIDETAIQEIPASIGDLQKLKRFSACNCLSLTQLPESISHVESLEVLALNGIEITKLPLSEELRVLQYLSISNCRSILSLPTSMGTLASLSELDLSSFGINELPILSLSQLPAAIWKLKRLEELHASGCRSLEGKIPKQIKMLSALRVLKLGYSRICGLPDSISGLPNLQTLDLLHCDYLISLSVSSKLMDRIPDISSLVNLGELFLGEGSQEPVLPVRDKIEKKECTLQLGSLLELKILQLSMLKIQLLPVGLHYLYKLKKLSLCCIHLKKLPRLPPGLFTLSLHHCKSQTMPDLSYLVLLSEFELFNCAVTEVPGLGKFKSLRVFRASHCDLQQVDELENLIFLASLNVSYCRSLERLPHLSNLTMLKDIKIEGCLMIPDDFYYVDSHLNLSEEQSSSLIEADSPSEVEYSKPAKTKRYSKPAKTKRSSFKGIEPIYEGMLYLSCSIRLSMSSNLKCRTLKEVIPRNLPDHKDRRLRKYSSYAVVVGTG
ncbi:hypothetical protein ACJRO7_014772 [Eucalyptus globulus]|uniref:TIR domain-containing protein n=1 Tax=Eucalyptus globulus TaxID=34317 RepID=A0ABD3L737_EUCGL